MLTYWKNLLGAVLFFSNLSISLAGIVSDKQTLPNFAFLLNDADTVVVYEGLPHPMFEGGALDVEKRTKKTFSIADAFFYEKILAVTADDQHALDRTFRETEVCVFFTGEKLCGGFHADYMIEWKRKDDRIALALLCFGCGEIKWITGEAIERYDLSKNGFEALRSVLRKYRQERPPYASGPQGPLKPNPPIIPPPIIDVKM